MENSPKYRSQRIAALAKNSGPSVRSIIDKMNTEMDVNDIVWISAQIAELPGLPEWFANHHLTQMENTLSWLIQNPSKSLHPSYRDYLRRMRQFCEMRARNPTLPFAPDRSKGSISRKRLSLSFAFAKEKMAQKQACLEKAGLGKLPPKPKKPATDE